MGLQNHGAEGHFHEIHAFLVAPTAHTLMGDVVIQEQLLGATTTQSVTTPPEMVCLIDVKVGNASCSILS